VYRNNEWLDRKAEIYIGSALLPGERARFLMRDQEINGSGTNQDGKFVHDLEEALKQANEALKITDSLARDKKNSSWQASHGSALHALGELKLLQWRATGNPQYLDASIADLSRARETRMKLNDAQPSQRQWMVWTLWTQVKLNEAEADMAKRNRDYA